MDLHLLARDEAARETSVFAGTVTDVDVKKGYCFVSFGAVKDGLLHRTTVTARNAKSKEMWQKQLQRGSKVRVMVSRVVLDKQIRKTRISLRVAPFRHKSKVAVHVERKQGLAKQQCKPRVQPKPAAQPDNRTLPVRVVGKLETATPEPVPEPEPEPTSSPAPAPAPLAPAVLAKWESFEPTKHFAPCTLFSFLPRPKAKTEKAQAEAKAFWRNSQIANLIIAPTVSKSAKRRRNKAAAKARATGSKQAAQPSNDLAIAKRILEAAPTIPVQQAACQATSQASIPLTKTAKRRQRRVAAKKARAVQHTAQPSKAAPAVNSPDLAAATAILSQLRPEQLAAVLSVAQLVRSTTTGT